MNRQSLLQLSAELDSVVSFDYQDEEEKKSHLLRNTAIAGAGAGGLYAAGKSSPYAEGALQKIGAGAMRVKDYAVGVGGEAVNAGKMYGYTRDLGLPKGAAAKGALAGLWSKLKGVKFSSRTESLVQLSAELDSVIKT